MDNNAVERAIHGVALGRKNWLLAGSNGGGEHATAVESLDNLLLRLDAAIEAAYEYDHFTDEVNAPQ